MEHLNRLPTATEMRSEGRRGRDEEGGEVGRQEKEECEDERKGRRDKCKDEEVGRKRKRDGRGRVE